LLGEVWRLENELGPERCHLVGTWMIVGIRFPEAFVAAAAVVEAVGEVA
jgi:hypothetical protein